MPSLRSSFLRSLKAAAKPYAEDGWHPRGVGLVYRSDDGCWGQIVFWGASSDPNYDGLHRPISPPCLRLGLTAGSCAPYLMRVVNQLDPLKPPPWRFVAAHTRVKWAVEVTYAESGPNDPKALPAGVHGEWKSPIELSFDTVSRWLDYALAELIPQTQAQCSERAVRDWLIGALPGSPPGGTFNIRYAILLTRHLGLLDELPGLIERARQLDLEDVERSTLMLSAEDQLRRDSQTDYPQDWSHDRFMRFFDETAP